MKIPTSSLFVVALLLVGLAAGVGIVQLRQVVNTPKASASTGTILFNPTTRVVPPESNINVILDPQNNPIGFTKVELNFDKNAITITDIAVTPKLTMIISAPNKETANATGVISATLGLAPADRANAPATAFDLLVIFFTNKNTSGSQSQLVFNSANSQIVDMANQQMVINSTPANIVVSAVTTTTTPTPTPTPTPYVGQPNSCGGTCGSHNNCQAGLFCYQGFCRNPLCQDQADCSCPGTPNTCGGTCGSNNNCQAGLFCFSGFCRNPLCKEIKDCKCTTPTATPKPTTTVVKLTPAPSASPKSKDSEDVVKIYNLDLQSLEPTPTPTPKPTFWQNFLNFFLRLFGIKY